MFLHETFHKNYHRESLVKAQKKKSRLLKVGVFLMASSSSVLLRMDQQPKIYWVLINLVILILWNIILFSVVLYISGILYNWIFLPIFSEMLPNIQIFFALSERLKYLWLFYFPCSLQQIKWNLYIIRKTIYFGLWMCGRW